jgi:hypothetical protein
MEKTAKGSERRMQLRKIVIALLALLLAGAVIVPCVSAADENVNLSGDTSNIVQFSDGADLRLPSDKPGDSKPAKGLPETDMINIVLSQKTVEKFGPGERSGIINIPVTYLETKTNFITSKEKPSFLTEITLQSDDGIVLIRMPKQMYERFVKKAQYGKLSLPADYFARYYENSSDMDSHLKADGNNLQVLPSEKYPLRKFTEETDPEPDADDSEPVMSPQKSSAVLSYPAEFEERRYYDVMDSMSSNDYDYCIGQITPDTWELGGSAHDEFDVMQEREYRFDSGEAIEIVVKYFDRDHNGIIELYPALYRNGAADPILPGEWNQYDGKIPVNANDIPHAWGYHVEIYGGYYYVSLQDMVTDVWYYYAEPTATGTSSFIELWGSSEYIQRAAPTTNTIEAKTDPVIDEWIHQVQGDNWLEPNEVWEYEDWFTASYVKVTKAWSSGDLITRSSILFD